MFLMIEGISINTTNLLNSAYCDYEIYIFHLMIDWERNVSATPSCLLYCDG